jgi:hypothetical protein
MSCQFSFYLNSPHHSETLVCIYIRRISREKYYILANDTVEMSVARSQVLILFRSINRHLRKIAYKQNEAKMNTIFIDFIRQEFKKNKELSDSKQIYELYIKGQEFLSLIHGLQYEIVWR